MTLNKRLKYVLSLIILSILLVGCGTNDNEESVDETFTIGVLNIVSRLDVALDGFKENMAELGYVEGENVTYIYDGAVSVPELADKAQELVEAEVDLIFTITTPASTAAQGATSDIPIVFTLVTDPIGAGLVDSWQEPGSNITGISDGGSELRRLELFVDMLPEGASSIYLPFNPLNSDGEIVFAELHDTASSLNIEFVAPESDDQNEAIANLPDSVDGIFLLPDATANAQMSEWAAVSIEKQIPVSSSSGINEGILMTYHAELDVSGRQAGRLATRILEGAVVGELPVESAEFYLQINLQTSEVMGFEISDEILDQAFHIVRGDE